MKISVLHPSRGRPEQAFEAAKRWVENADNEFEYIVMCDYSDPVLPTYEYLFFTYFNCSSFIWADNNHSAIEAINNAAKIATGDLFVVISDDMDCFLGWDTALLAELAGKSDFVLKTQDGIQKTLVTLPIMDRVWYERYGYILEPGYSHMYSDQELTAVAAMTGRLLYSDLLFEHKHYMVGKAPMDETYKRSAATYPQGLVHFEGRRKNNFGIENPVTPYRMIQW
jgi:hypothetical protein